MSEFRFRAQVALDLRRRRDEEAQRRLGDARRALAAAEAVRAAAESRLIAALAEAGTVEQEGADVTQRTWYRNWIALLRQEVARADQVLKERRDQVRDATVRALQARRHLRSIERLRERRWRAFSRERDKAEQRQADLLATLRHAARRQAEQ